MLLEAFDHERYDFRRLTPTDFHPARPVVGLGREPTPIDERAVGGEPDPHIHHHAYLFNVTWDGDEKAWKAGEFSRLLLDKPDFEAAFDARLALGMRGLGFEIERRGKGWDLAGMTTPLLGKFSRRTAEIEAEAKRRGITDVNEKDRLGARTRSRKAKSMNMDELRSRWRDRMNAGEHRDSAEVLEKARNRVREPGERSSSQFSVHEALNYGMAKLFQTHSVTDGRKIQEEAMLYGVGYVAPEDTEVYRNMPGVLTVDENERVLVTTREVLAEEARMLECARDDMERLRARVAYRRKHEAHTELMKDRIAVGEGRRRGGWFERFHRPEREGPDHGR